MWDALLISKKTADCDSLDLFHYTLMGCKSQFKKNTVYLQKNYIISYQI